MKVTVSRRTNSIDSVLCEEILSRIYFFLIRFSPRIDEVTVKIGDVVAMGAARDSSAGCRYE